VKRAYRIALRPSRKQRAAFAQHAGAARWAWNWGLARKRAAYEATGKSPGAIELHRQLNELKKLPVEEGGVPWMYEVSKCAPQEALRDLDAALKRFFDKSARYPRFKSRERQAPHFRLTGTIRVDEQHIQLPRIGRVRIAPGERGYAPSQSYAQVSLVQEPGGRWYASVVQEQAAASPVALEGPAEVGIDLGVRKLATLSDGSAPYENPRALEKAALKLRRASRALSRSRKSSARRQKKRRRQARLHGRVAALRRDAIHKATTDIASRFKVVAIEDLRVKNMTRSAKGTPSKPGRNVRSKAGLNRAVLDASFAEFRRQLQYKLAWRGGRLIAVPAAWTSQRCSCCGSFNDPGKSELYACAACGLRMDRDLNAARNILAAASCSEAQNARGAGVRPARRSSPSRQSASKREQGRKVVSHD
jgi:putative transposase